MTHNCVRVSTPKIWGHYMFSNPNYKNGAMTPVQLTDVIDGKWVVVRVRGKDTKLQGAIEHLYELSSNPTRDA